MEATIFTDKMQIDKRQADQLLKKELETCMEEYISEFSTLLGEVRDNCKQTKCLSIVGKSSCIDITNKFAFFDPERFAPLRVEVPSSGFDFSEYLENHSPVEGLGGELPLLSQLKIRRRELLRSDDDIEIYYFYESENQECYLYDPKYDRIAMAFGEGYIFPVNNLSFADPTDLLINILVPYELCPKGLSDKAKELFSDLVLLRKIDKDYVVYSTDEKTKFALKKLWRILWKVLKKRFIKSYIGK